MAEDKKKNSHKADHLEPHQFKPGKSGNPKGRPKKGESIKDIAARLGDEKQTTRHSREKMTRKEAMVMAQYDRAIEDKSETAFRNLSDRLDGKPVQEIRVNNDQPIDAPVHIHIAGAVIEFDDAETGDGDTD